MGLLREDGAPKPALQDFYNYTPDPGICQWFHFEDRDRGSSSLAPGTRHGSQRFDRRMKALEPFVTTPCGATSCDMRFGRVWSMGFIVMTMADSSTQGWIANTWNI